MLLPPPRSTLLPYTSLFRSDSLHFAMIAVSVNAPFAITAVVADVRVNHARSWPRSSVIDARSEEDTSELQSLAYIVCRLLLEKKKSSTRSRHHTSLAPSSSS